MKNQTKKNELTFLDGEIELVKNEAIHLLFENSHCRRYSLPSSELNTDKKVQRKLMLIISHWELPTLEEALKLIASGDWLISPELGGPVPYYALADICEKKRRLYEHLTYKIKRLAEIAETHGCDSEQFVAAIPARLITPLRLIGLGLKEYDECHQAQTG